MAHSHAHLREVHPGRKRAHEMAKHFKRGGKVHGDEKEDRKLFGKMIKEHDSKPEGKKSGGRLDKYARGGKTKGGHHTKINIVVAPKGPHPADGAAPAGPLPPVGPGGPPMPPPGLGAGPPGAPPMPPPGMRPPMRKGGRVKLARGGVASTKPAKIGKGYKAGADSGEGRLEKAHKY